jgi:cytochrome P450
MISNTIQCFLYILYTTVYNLYFHPLRTFPGPKFNAFSGIPITISLMRGTPQHDVLRLHNKYGPIVRVEPNGLSFITAEAWKDVYSWTNTKKFQKANVVQPRNGVHALPMIVDDENHLRHRKFYNPAFSDRALNGQEKKIMGHIDTFIEKLKEKEEVDICGWIQFLMFDMMGDLAFGESFGCLKESRYHRWVSILFDCMRAMAFVGLAARFAPFHNLIYLANYLEINKLLNNLTDHNKMSGEKARKRIDQGDDDKPDFWTYFLEKGNSEKDALSMEEMEMVGSVLIVAGSDTTVSALSGTIYYLLRTPEAMKKLCHEIRSTFDEEVDIGINSVKPLPYLHATIQEGLRLFPPAPIGLTRVAPAGGASVAGYFIPGGVSFLIIIKMPLTKSLDGSFNPTVCC